MSSTARGLWRAPGWTRVSPRGCSQVFFTLQPILPIFHTPFFLYITDICFWLLVDGNSAAAELGIEASNANAPTKLAVIANDERVHHLVVCTLCSCYPAALLGPSPTWYKSREYRARAVRAPRALLEQEFGMEIPSEVEVRVHDSTADLRWLVIPARPAGTDGWDEERLRELVTRDGMVGTAPV